MSTETKKPKKCCSNCGKPPMTSEDWKKFVEEPHEVSMTRCLICGNLPEAQKG